ncbi:MAG TPA: indole-3-glycerol phosphate synthase TrpC, partial [Kofleriaceae bacterium]|nr:indole-3-glycerol phosphate synthase TrpC [Kofleriaceae bacterium]
RRRAHARPLGPGQPVVSSILAEILRHKRAEVAAARADRPLAAVEAAARAAGPVRPVAAALRRPAGAPVRVLAEIKRASPSAGAIRAGADPAAVAREYAAAGAAAISVLTDERFFDGRLEFLARVRAAVRCPLLRKDFVIDRYQVVEARAAGADAVLLIAAALQPDALADLLAEATRQGLDALVEIHREAEAEVALAAGARLIGVNHRDLATFEIDMGLTARLAPRLPADAVLVAESGIKSAADVRRLADAGAHAVLVGEALMRAPSPGAALADLLAG